MEWQEFELKVADLFKLFGYDVDHNTKINGAQTDIFAKSNNRFKTNLLIECKHFTSNKNVSIDDVENFIARVITLRSQGKIDKGYLITNTGFTSDAKGAIQNVDSFVMLSTFNQLFNDILDLEFYLKEFVKSYESQNLHQLYVDLSVTSHFRTSSDLDWNYMQANSSLFSIDQSVLDQLKIDGNELNRQKNNLPYFQGAEMFLSIYADNVNYLSPEEKEITEKFIKKNPELFKQKKRERYLYALQNIDKSNGALNICTSYTKSNKNLLIILGDYGSGKSSCMNQLMYVLSKQKLNSPADSSVPYPLLINLKDYNKVSDFDSLLTNYFTINLGSTNMNIRIFNELNRQGYFIILLDGFDEMASLVTNIERRLTLHEIFKQINPKSKVIVSSRPGYFPEDAELFEILRKLMPSKKYLFRSNGFNIPSELQIVSLSLMNHGQLEDYLKKRGAEDLLNTLVQKENSFLYDLAHRPILANIIIETIEELRELESEELTLAKLYELYTNKWIRREEDKGLFRVLINQERKMKFLTSLSVNMAIKRNFEIHFNQLDDQIMKYFNLDEKLKIDHFSHDIRTCSFLSRNEKGEYRFIHKSFYEYFIAREYFKFEKSLYIEDFKKKGFPYSREAFKFLLKQDKLPTNLILLRKIIDELAFKKNLVVKKQKYESAARLRDLEKKGLDFLEEDWPYYKEKDKYDSLMKELNSISCD